MTQRMRRTWGLAGTAVLTAALAACGGEAPRTADAAEDGALRVGIFVDNAFGDGDFFDQAGRAQQPLEDDGAVVNTYEGQLQAQNFEPLLQDAADANDLVFVLGFEAIDAMTKVAAENPDTTFVFVDAVVDDPNIVSAVFRTAEGCFMAGALAATVNSAQGSSVAGFIGGVNAPVVENCESGYDQGVAQVDPAQSVASQYVGSFVDPAKGREITLALAQRGAYSVFAYAGLSGAGAFDAASSGESVAPIGVVADKSDLAPGKVPGSLEMGVDAVILELADQYRNDDLERGSQHDYGFAEGGWAMVYDDSLLTPDQIAALEALEQQIVDGELQISA
ncbi:BMP family lipoprotein [Blastococcus sp. PRF04-17]|uniref:BMP family lipoprotein n=1 Tax=Blastococcus sp. PRF04-17 TaxID=2933797 RepID=UPI001FF4BA98|nr:BMP family ABC transporter substrate-binding protein [Blastococcus sp. PRF04-17]UOY03351.1 BMP family ABC transporter substrate-binding protein [Blastococcus sp. PRF04-17]